MILIVNNGKTQKSSENITQLTGEKIPGDLDGWKYFGTNPNDLLKLSYKQLSERSTTLYHTYAPISAAIDKTDMYAVGPGLVFRSQPDWKMLGITKEYAKDWGLEFQKLVHYYFSILNFYQKQSIIFRTADIMGDSLLFFDRETPESGLPFDLIETGGDQIDWEKDYYVSSNDQATLGIKHDKFLRRKGIYQCDTESATLFRDKNGDQNVIQFFNKSMARQLRGMPLGYRRIAAAKNNDRLWDATLQRAVMETVMIGYKEGGNPADLDSQLNELATRVTGTTDADTGIKTEATTKQLQGGLFSFNSGESLKFTDLKTPSNNFDKMQLENLKLDGMATNVPAEVIASMYSTSFTAHKGALNDFVKSFMKKRNNLINTVCNIVVLEIAKHIFLSGKMKMPHPEFFNDPIIQMATLAGNWLGPVPGHINPKVEVESEILKVTNAAQTRGDFAALYGNEFDNMIKEWQAQEEEWKKGSPEQQGAIMQDQEEELNNQEDDNNDNQDDNQDDVNNDSNNGGE